MSVNFWFEHEIDAYLEAVAAGCNGAEACAVAERAECHAPRRILTQKDLKAKGLNLSRQHVAKKVRGGTFPRPFQLPVSKQERLARTAHAKRAASEIDAVK